MEHPLDKHSKRQARKWLDPRVALLLSTKSSAKTRGVENTLTKEDIKIPNVCPILGLKLKRKGLDNNSMTVDRLDSNKGYTKDNVHVISWRANKLKNNGTLEEFERIVDYIRSNT